MLEFWDGARAGSDLQRKDVHPLEEAQGFRALLDLDEPKYSIEQIAAKVGKSAVFVASRLKLTDLVPAAVDAFYADEIGVGHAILLAKLPADQQEPALKACFKEVYNNGASKPARILLPVRNLQFWIDSNILLVLKDAPFNKRDAELVPAAGSCADCPKRTGHNKLLFGDDLGRQGDRCTDPGCYQAKVASHVAKTIAAKPELVQISTAYGGQKEGSRVLPRNKYTTIRDDKPKSKDDAKRPEFKVCKFTTEAIITEGSDVGTIHKVCANPACPVHHPKQSTSRSDEKWKAEQEKQRREQAIRDAIQVTLVDLHLRKGLPPQTKYNGAQRIAYTAVILMGFGMLVTGLAIYKPTQLHLLTTILGGYEMARWEHFWITMGFVGFFVIHVVQVVLAGWNNFRSMVSGREIKKEEDVSLEAERRSW